MSIDVEITIIRSNRKTLSIELKPNEIIARVPIRMKEKEIIKFIESKKDWIDKHLTKLNERQKVIEDLKPFTQDEIKQFTAKAKVDIPKRVEFYAKQIGVTYNKITIRCQHTRWGSCSSKGNLNFNCLLVLLPDEIIDSIVVHELCHIKQMNHSARFYAEIDKVFPNYKQCHLWLKQNGGMYLNRISRLVVLFAIPFTHYLIDFYKTEKEAEALYITAETHIWEYEDFEQGKELLETIPIDYKDKEPLIAYCQAKIDFYSGYIVAAYYAKDDMIFSYQTPENLDKVGLFFEVVDDGYEQYLKEKYESEESTTKNNNSQYKPNNQYKPSYNYKPSYSDEDRYDIDRYSNEEDFYYDNYENFIDYYEAEKYFKEHKK